MTTRIHEALTEDEWEILHAYRRVRATLRVAPPAAGPVSAVPDRPDPPDPAVCTCGNADAHGHTPAEVLALCQDGVWPELPPPPPADPAAYRRLADGLARRLSDPAMTAALLVVWGRAVADGLAGGRAADLILWLLDNGMPPARVTAARLRHLGGRHAAD